MASPFLFPPTELSYAIMNNVESLLQQMNMTIERFSGLLATRETAFIHLPEHKLFIYAGHAKTDALCGENVFACDLVTVSDAPMFEGEIVVANPACQSAATLGPAIVKAGAKAFLGSIEDMNCQFNEAEHNYMDDWFDYTLTFYKSVFTKTMAEAVDDWKTAITGYLNLYQAHLNDWPNADYYYSAAKMNRDNFVVLGDSNATLAQGAADPVSTEQMGLLQGFSSLFNPETLRTQLNSVLMSLSGFSVVAATVAALAVPAVTGFAIDKGWLTKEQADWAKAVIPGVAAAIPYG